PVSLLVFRLAAAAVPAHSASRRRLRTFVAWFGASLALIALVQIAVAARRIYGIFMPLQSETFFGVFVNRDHFAAYMTLCAMAGLGVLHRALQGYRYELGARSSLRRQLVALRKPEGNRVSLAVVPVLMPAGPLVAATARGPGPLAPTPGLARSRRRYPRSCASAIAPPPASRGGSGTRRPTTITFSSRSRWARSGSRSGSGDWSCSPPACASRGWRRRS